MTADQQFFALIVGGGIGGLSAALSVAEKGRTVCVLEKAAEFAEIGAGLQLAPNAMAALDHFGVLDAVLENAVFPGRLVLLDAITGEELSSLSLGETFRQRFGYPYIVTHRSDLLSALLEACRKKNNITLLNRKEVVSVEPLEQHVRVVCSDQSVYTAQAVVGADGLWSNTRRLLVEDEVICSRFVAYRGTIPTSEISRHAHFEDVVCWIGPDLHLVQYPIRRKELYNQVVVFKSYRYRPDSDDWGTTEEMDERFSRCCPQVRHAVSFIQRHRRWPLYDREPIGNWTVKMFTLLGDAAHPMLQYLAQGACQALEDAILLRNELLKKRKPEDYSVVDWQYGHRLHEFMTPHPD